MFRRSWRSRIWLKDISSECLRIGCPPFPESHVYYPSRRHSSPEFALLVDALRYVR